MAGCAWQTYRQSTGCTCRERGRREAASLFSSGSRAVSYARRQTMFVIFIEDENGIDYSKVYALCASEQELDMELEYCEEQGASYDWRRIY
jgi:hypothetical protein